LVREVGWAQFADLNEASDWFGFGFAAGKKSSRITAVRACAWTCIPARSMPDFQSGLVLCGPEDYRSDEIQLSNLLNIDNEQSGIAVKPVGSPPVEPPSQAW